MDRLLLSAGTGADSEPALKTAPSPLLSPPSTAAGAGGSAKFNLRRAMRQLEEEVQLTGQAVRVHHSEIEQAKLEVRQFEVSVQTLNNESLKTLGPSIASLLENLNNHIQMQKAENDLYSKQIAELRREKAGLQAQCAATGAKVFELEEFVGLHD